VEEGRRCDLAPAGRWPDWRGREMWGRRRVGGRPAGGAGWSWTPGPPPGSRNTQQMRRHRLVCASKPWREKKRGGGGDGIGSLGFVPLCLWVCFNGLCWAIIDGPLFFSG
jgi:hypothetical protein